MAVDLMVTTFVGGAVMVTSVPPLSSVTGRMALVLVGRRCLRGALRGAGRERDGGDGGQERTGRILGIGMGLRGSGGGAREHVARARGRGARRTSGGPPTSGRRDPATAGRVPRTE